MNEQSISITRIQTSGENVTELLKVLPKGIQEDVKEATQQNDLTQFLGVALRGILPYAENEVASLHEAAHRDGEAVLLEEAAAADVMITRAQAALNRLNDSTLSIEEVEDDAFDDTFQVNFDEE